MNHAWVEPEWALATIAFVDIRGFTTFADRATAREAVAYLSEFFELAVPVISDHGGYVNKLLGDGLLAVFGAPEALPSHADDAVTAANELLVAVESRMGDRCRIGIGINSGLVLVGTMGAGSIVGLEIVGDPVNVAARVQGATRDLEEPLLVTEATRLLLNDGGDRLVSRGELALRGKAKPIGVYGLAERPVTFSGRPGDMTPPT